MKFYSIILLTLIPVLGVQAKVFKMDEFVKSYLEKSVSVKEEKLNLEKSKHTKAKAEGVDDYKLSADTNYTYKKGGTEGSSTIDNTNMYNIIAKIDKAISETGSILSFSHGITYLDNKYIPSTITISGQSIPMGYSVLERFTPAFTVSLIQPLLKNFMGMQMQMPKKIAAIDEKIKEINYYEALENKMLEAMNLYFDWLASTCTIIYVGKKTFWHFFS